MTIHEAARRFEWAPRLRRKVIFLCDVRDHELAIQKKVSLASAEAIIETATGNHSSPTEIFDSVKEHAQNR